MQGCVPADSAVGHIKEDLLQGSGWVSSFRVSCLGLSSQGILFYLLQHDDDLLLVLTMLLHQQGCQIGNLQCTWETCGTWPIVGMWVVREDRQCQDGSAASADEASGEVTCSRHCHQRCRECI